MTAAVDERAHAERVRELEAGLGPFDDPGWRDDLALLSSTVRGTAMLMARDCEALVALAARVPRSPGDERGGTPWTSFLREVAVARKVSDRAAAAEVALAHELLGRHPRTFDLLLRGQVPAHRARLLVEECAAHVDAVAAAAEQQLAHRLGSLAPWQIRGEVGALALRLDAEAQARQEAEAAAERTASCTALPHGQAEIVLTGPAVQVQRYWDALTERARALKAAGDPRNLGALRFDLATTCDPRGLTGSDPLTDVVTGSGPGGAGPGGAGPGADGGVAPGSAFGLGVPLREDARCSRPVQATITVPAATALGLSEEPGWLDGHGWISAPQCRRLLTVAELRKACVHPVTGQLIDLADRIERPPPDPEALRQAIRRMVLQPHELRPTVTDSQPQHDPSPALAAFVAARDRWCDGPTGTKVPARRAQKDHERPWPAGPTAAWNLASRSTRTHQLKHAGWHPVRDAHGTTWTSPAGQTIHVPHSHHPPPTVHPDQPLPDPHQLAAHDAELLRARPRPWPDIDEPDDETGQATATPDQPRPEPTRPTINGWPDDPGF